MSNHIIHKQEVILNVESIDNAFSYQQTVSNLFANGLTTAIEEVLNDADTPGTVIRIDKLDLDLGEISAGSFAESFKEKFIQQLRESLHAIHNKKEFDVTVTKEAQSIREGFIYFIENGTLPWYIEVKNMEAFESLVFKEWSEADWIIVIEWLRQNVYKPSIIERLVSQYSQKILQHIVASALQQNIEDNEWQLLTNDLKLIYSKIESTRSTQTILLASALHLVKFFELLFEHNKSFTLDELIATQLHNLFSSNNNVNLDSQQRTLLNVIKSKQATLVLSNIYLLRENEIPLKHVAPKELLITGKDLSDKLSSFNHKEESKINNESTFNENGSPVNKTKHKKDRWQEEDVLFVDNCGIVLLHPFLQSYFETLLLIENKKFISDEAQKRAILLLYYLSTGLTQVAEFSLVLQKILCGFNVDETLPSSIMLLQDEVDESEKLLQSVISYWPPLKNTSAAGLQNTFLQRKGKLAISQMGWQLTVEQKTVDILINKLPWGFSTIKLPWMQGVLNVEWC